MSAHEKTQHNLKLCPFGQTGMNITRVGFGSWAVGGDWAVGWGAQDDVDSITAIHHALAQGINWIDTAAIYGLGHSEEVVGKAVRGIASGERPYIFTKCGLIGDPENPNAGPKQVGDPKSIRHEVEGSLRRLGVERIDLYQMHWPAEDGTKLEDYWQTLLDLKTEGKIRAAGLSNHNIAQLSAAEALGHVDTLQPPFSAIKREAGNKEIAWCAEHETGVIVYSPMQAGLLTGAFSKERAATLPKNDWRSRNAEFQGEKLERNLKVAALFGEIGARHGISAATVAIAWTLAWPGVTGAIVGARSPKQVDGWIAAAQFELSGAEIEDIAVLLAATGAGYGAIKPAKRG